MLSVKYVFHIWQETNGWIVILKTVLKSDLWPGSEKCGFNPKLEDNDLKSGCYRVPKLPPLSVNYVCPISHETKHPIMITKIVLKSVLWRGSESARYFCIFQFLCFSLHPTGQYSDVAIQNARKQSNLKKKSCNPLSTVLVPGLIAKYKKNSKWLTNCKHFWKTTSSPIKGETLIKEEH